jgi:predicted Zn-dependent protease
MPTKVKLDPFLPGYGREGELAVDREGAKLAMQAGYSAEAAVRLLKTYVILGDHMPTLRKKRKKAWSDGLRRSQR